MTEQELKQAQEIWDKIARLIGISDICGFGDESGLEGVSVGEMKLLMKYVVELGKQIDELRTKACRQDEIGVTQNDAPKKEPRVALDEDGYTQTERIAFKDYCDSMRDCFECPANSYSGPCIEHFVHNTYSNYIRKHRELFDRHCHGRDCGHCEYLHADECFAAFLQGKKGNTV